MENVVHWCHGRCWLYYGAECHVLSLTTLVYKWDVINRAEQPLKKCCLLFAGRLLEGDSVELSCSAGPAKVILEPNQVVVLDCNLAPAEQVINITWKRNGFPLVEQEHLHVLPNGSLFISSQAVAKDSKYSERADAEGNYSCVSHSSLGAVTSQTAAVRFSSKWVLFFPF